MRKNFSLFTSIVLMVLLIAGTNMVAAETIKINKSVNGISNIVLESYGDLIITQGTENALTIETTEKNVDNLICNKEGRTLTLKTKGNNSGGSSFFGLFSSSDNDKLKYFLTLKTINEIASDGSGSITVKTNLTSKNLKLKLAGSGGIDLKNVNATSIDLHCSGSGDFSSGVIAINEQAKLKLEGSGDVELDGISASNIDVDSSGSGEFNADSMKIDNHTSITLTGSGDIEVEKLKTNSLDSELSSSANIELSGIAKLQESSVTGSGNYSASDLKSQTAKVEMSGSGDMTVNVAKSISIKTNGSGSLKIIGKPSVSSMNSSGSGSVSFVN